MNILIISGTARNNSNTLKIAGSLEDRFDKLGCETNKFDLREKTVPLLGNRTYKENEEPVPDDIKELGRLVENSDCVVIVSPEYNHSIPGILKTTLDYMWPEYDGKPFTYVMVSDENYGGVRALNDLQKIIRILGGLSGPELPISNISQKISHNEITDEKLSERIDEFVEATERFVERPSQEFNPYLG